MYKFGLLSYHRNVNFTCFMNNLFHKCHEFLKLQKTIIWCLRTWIKSDKVALKGCKNEWV